MNEEISRRDVLLATLGGAVTAALAGVEDAGAGAQGLPQRMLGKTGVRVPILALGTAPAGTGLDDRAAIALYDEAIDRGVSYLDTALNPTSYGRAQIQLGHVLQERRKEVFLTTKTLTPDGDEARRMLERSLRELRTDHVDLAYVHNLGDDRMEPGRVLGPRGSLRALLRAREEGLTRFVGLSGHNRPMRFVQALRAHDVDVIMNAVNFVDRHTYAFETKVWPLAARQNVGLVAMKVFGGQKGHTCRMPAEHLPLALRYALSLPQVATAVVGMTSRAELRQNVAWAKAFQPLSVAERAELERAGRALAQEWGPHLGVV